MNNVEAFVAILKHFNLFQPEEVYKVICPFHPDKNASMQINIPKAFFYCYAECGAKGSTLELYQMFQQKEGRKINALQAMQEIQQIAKQERHTPLYNNIYNIYNNTNTSFVEIENKLSYKEGIKQSKNYFNTLPTPNWFKPSSNSAIEEETRLCLKYMQARGFTKLTLKKANAKPSLNKYYPIVIPLVENKVFRGYVMRTFDKEVEQKRKYMYNTGFKRERCLPGSYGLKNGFGSKKQREAILLVEGYLDKLKANQIGIKNVAAVLGWKLSATQIEHLQKAGIKKLICGTDNDEAGNKGYNYMKRISSNCNFVVERIRFPKGIKDFGDIVQNSKEAELMLNQVKRFGGC